jgi:hypothetical protein
MVSEPLGLSSLMSHEAAIVTIPANLLSHKTLMTADSAPDNDRFGSLNETARAVERCAQAKPIGTTESASDSQSRRESAEQFFVIAAQRAPNAVGDAPTMFDDV